MNDMIGHNNPPADPFLDRLLETHSALFDKWGALELASFKLPTPQDVKTDADQKRVEEHVKALKAFQKLAEDSRKHEKDEFLVLGRKVDAFFNDVKKPAIEAAATTEAILVPYLRAKREAAEAAAKAEQTRIAEESRIAAEKQAILDAQAAKARAEVEEQARKVREAQNEEARAAAQIEMQAAAIREQEAQAEREAEATANTQAIADAEAAARVLARAPKGPTIKTTLSPAIVDMPALVASLGPLGPHFTDKQIFEALDRVGKANIELTVPGVSWATIDTAQVRATKGSTP